MAIATAAVSLLGACGQSPSGTLPSPTARPSSPVSPAAPIQLDSVPSAHIAFDAESRGLAAAQGFVLRTSDGGRTWQRVVETSGPIRDLLWVGPGRALAASADGVMASLDTGLTWHPSNQSSMGRRVIALDFPDAATGFAVTADGGLWAVSEDAGQFVRRESTGLSDVTAVSFVDRQHGWAVGPDGVATTTDNGTTWTVQATPSLPGLPRPPLIHMADLRHGYVVERYGPGAGAVSSGLVATDDGGAHWSYRSGPSGNSGPPTPLFATMPPGIDDVDVEGPEALLAASVSDVVSGMQACTSPDGGRHWSCKPSGLSNPAQIGTAAAAIARLDDGALVAVSLTNQGALEVTTSSDGGSTWSVSLEMLGGRAVGHASIRPGT